MYTGWTDNPKTRCLQLWLGRINTTQQLLSDHLTFLLCDVIHLIPSEKKSHSQSFSTLFLWPKDSKSTIDIHVSGLNVSLAIAKIGAVLLYCRWI